MQENRREAKEGEKVQREFEFEAEKAQLKKMSKVEASRKRREAGRSNLKERRKFPVFRAKEKMKRKQNKLRKN